MFEFPHPAILDKLSSCTIVGEQPVVGVNVKSAITSGLTQIVWDSEVIPQELEPVYKVIVYIPGVLKVIFSRFAAVGSQAPELFGWLLLYPKFSFAEINEFVINTPPFVTGIIPDGPITVQYFL